MELLLDAKSPLHGSLKAGSLQQVANQPAAAFAFQMAQIELMIAASFNCYV